MGKLVRCRYCGEEIELMRTNTFKTIPCQRTSCHFNPGGGPDTFVTEDGRAIRGERSQFGTEYGHPKHAKYCREKIDTGRL